MYTRKHHIRILKAEEEFIYRAILLLVVRIHKQHTFLPPLVASDNEKRNRNPGYIPTGHGLVPKSYHLFIHSPMSMDNIEKALPAEIVVARDPDQVAVEVVFYPFFFELRGDGLEFVGWEVDEGVERERCVIPVHVGVSAQLWEVCGQGQVGSWGHGDGEAEGREV